MKILKSIILIPKSIFNWCTKTRLRKVLSLTLAIVIFLTSIKFIFTPAPNVRASDVLLGFNEGYGATINDNNSNVTGTIANAVWKTSEFCKTGNCLYFDGTGDYVSFGDDSDMDFAAATNFTIEGWFRTPDITSGQRTLVAKHNATAGGYKVYMDSSGYLIFGVDDDSTWTPDDSVSTTSTAFDDNKWHYFSAVKTGTTSITIYVDGIQYQTDSSIAATGTLVNSDTLYVGIDGNGSSNAFSGFLDEVKIYTTTARSSIEIKADYTGETSSRGTSASFGPSQDYLSNGLVGYWNMEEAGDATRLDSSGNSNTLTESTSDTIAQAAGKFGNGSDFESGDTETLSAGSLTGISSSDNITLSSWVKLESAPSCSTCKAEVVQIGGEFALVISEGTTDNNIGAIAITYWNGSSYIVIGTSTEVISVSNWYHLTVTLNKNLAEYKTYINGELNTSGTLSQNVGVNSVEIGGLSDDYFDGVLDDVRVYNRALSPAEVQNLYNFAPGPVNHWKLDENTGTTVYDSGTNGYNGTIYGSPKYATGKFGSSVKFDGVTGANDSHILINQTDALNSLTQGTVSMWVKPTDTGDSPQQQFFVATTDGSAEWYEIGYQPASGLFHVYMSAGTCTAGTNFDATVTIPGTETDWHHVSLVVSSSGNKIFVDGIQQTPTYSTGDATDSCFFNDWNPAGTEHYSIGCDTEIGFAGDCYEPEMYEGSIDDVRVYSYPRSNSQIIEDMNGGHPSPGSPIGSALGYWQFDEGYGDTVNNAGNAGSTISGNLAGVTSCPQSGDSACPSWSNSGKFGKALDFEVDSTDDYIQVSDSGSLDITGELTVSAWVKPESNTSSTYYTILYKGNGTTNGNYYLQLYGDEINFGYYNGGWKGVATTNSNLQVGTWYHIAGTKDDNTNEMNIYLNGILQTDDNYDPNSDLVANSDPLYIGSSNVAGEYFDGLIDEIKIYNFILSHDQVKVEYNRGSGQSMGSLSTTSSGVASNADTDSYCPPGQGSTCTGPLAEYKFDENSGTSAQDSSGNGYTGTLNSFPTNPWKTGKFGPALGFDGTDDDVSISDGANFSVSAFTVSAWIYRNSDTGASEYVFDTREADNDGIRLDIGASGDDDIECSHNTFDSTITQTEYVPTGEWVHVACTSDGTNILTYLNGMLTSTTTGVTGSISETGSSKIGERSYTTGGVFNGQIDTLRFYNYARSPAQIAWDMNRGAPVGHWQMDEASWTNDCSTNSAYDASGNAFHGKSCPNTTGPTTPITGKINNAGSFDGSDDYVSLPTTSILDGAPQASVSVWIYPSSGYTSDYRAIYYVSTSAPSNNFFLQLLQTTGEIRFYINPTICDTTGFAPAINTWTHIVGTYDGAEMKIYKDGHLVKSGCSKTGSITDSGIEKNIGRYEGTFGGTHENFKGSIDDLRIYNYALTAQQVNLIMNDNSAVKFTQ